MATTFWVSPDIDQWRLQREGHHRADRICGTRDEAIDWACRMAVESSPCKVKVQDYSGQITAQYDFAMPTGRYVAA